MDCRPFTARRSQCHSIYGTRGEECLDEELTEKRCLSLHHCPQQAKEYYGSAIMDIAAGGISSSSSSPPPPPQSPTLQPSFRYHKALCASWAEAFAYDKELEHGERVARHHQEARDVVNHDATLKKECRKIAFDLASCLRRKRLPRG